MKKKKKLKTIDDLIKPACNIGQLIIEPNELKEFLINKEKDCKHEWRFLERWFGSDDRTEYVFYCIHCLEVTSQQLNVVSCK